MHILYLTPGCFDKGGISRYSRYQIEALREIYGEDNVRVLSLLGPDSDSFEEKFEVQWHGRGKQGQVTMADRIAFTWHVLKYSASWRPDVIHSAHVNFGALLTKAGRISQAKTILNVYGLEIWSGLSASRQSHMKKTDQVIADCHFTADYVKEAGLHKNSPTVIWDCVDLERFTPASVNKAVLEKYGIPDPTQHFIVLSLGRLAKAAAHKGFDRLIEVIAIVAKDKPNLRLVIAGRGDDRPRLEDLAIKQGIKDHVIFTGSVDEEDLVDLYRLPHIFSLVSDRGHGRGEGIPLTPLEAMACGTPILVGNEDGSQEAVIDNRNGFIVPPHEKEQHAKTIRKLMEDPDFRQKMGQEATDVAKENFSYSQFVEKHRALYSQFIQQKK